MSEGIAIFDTSCFRFLESEDAQERILRDLRAAGWDAWPSAINALEISQAKSPTIRTRLKRTIRALFRGKNILPWPHVLVERTAYAIANADTRVSAGDSHLDWLLDGDSEIDPTDVERSKSFLTSQVRAFEAMHDRGRPQIQNYLKEHNLKEEWTNLPAFLDNFWMQPHHIDTYFRRLWTHFGLPEPVPLEVLRQAETWTLFLEAHGAAVFERAVMHETPKRVHLPDLLQLVYLAGGQRRMIVTDDKPLLRAACGVLQGRYDTAWAVPISSFLG